TIGRAARHVNGAAILYGDTVTRSMRQAIDETERRRNKQIAFNAEHGITPVSVVKRVKDILEGVYGEARDAPVEASAVASTNYAAMDEKALAKAIRQLEKTMQTHARNLEFEQAAALRDELFRLRAQAFGADQHGTSDQE
ncbi:MAG: UvrB/UvrC motif-containing protein, partial [Rhodocyclaceae bacterium]|nr:UvrB/UvrC motif-containing protein [Rhodocyclaceae bacterium]